MKRLGIELLICLAMFLLNMAFAVAQVQTGIVTGIAFEDLNNNGRRDTGEPCVGPVVLGLRAASGGAERTTSSICGEISGYTFERVPAGSHVISVKQTPGNGYTTPSFTIGVKPNVSNPRDIPLAKRSGAVMSINPTPLTFGNQRVGTVRRLLVTVTNRGTGTMSVGAISKTGSHAGDFALSGNCANSRLTPNSSCSIAVDFRPSAAGTRSATLVIASNASGSPHTVSISGLGAVPSLQVTPSSLAFGGQPVGSTSTPRVVVLRNNGNADLQIGSIRTSGNNAANFAIAGVSGTGPLVPGASRTVQLTFTPTLVANYAAFLTIISDDPSGPRNLPLSGSGTTPAAPAIRLVPDKLGFGEQDVATTSQPQSVVVTNVGNANLQLQSISPNGSNAGDFGVVSGGGGGTVAPGANRTIVVRFTPSAPGTRVANLVIVSNAPGSPHLVSLSGTGVSGPPITPATPVANVGDVVAAGGRLSIFNFDPLDADQDISLVRRVTDSGAMYILDHAGTALFRMGGPVVQTAGRAAVEDGTAESQPRLLQTGEGRPELRLDTSSKDPVDGVGLARILRVETGRDGTCAILALRADHNRAIYFMDPTMEPGRLVRLVLLPGPIGPAELAIGDSGQISYVGYDSRSTPTLYQTESGRPVQRLGAGQNVVDGSGRVVIEGNRLVGLTALSSNGSGGMVFLAAAVRSDGKLIQAVVRAAEGRLRAVAVTEQAVEHGRGSGITGPLAVMERPRIGPNGTIVFMGAGIGFVNFYVDGPAQQLQPILVGASWDPDTESSEYAIAANGAVCLWATGFNAPARSLFLMGPAGGYRRLDFEPEKLAPAGIPVFGPNESDSVCFLLGREMTQPLDRNGRPPLSLLRVRPSDNTLALDHVAAPGDPVPGKPAGTQVLSVSQRAVVAGNQIFVGALYGTTEKLPVPTAGLFRIPLTGTIAQGSLLLDEGLELPGTDRIAQLRDLSYTTDGKLIYGGLLPGAGPIVGTAVATGIQAIRTGTRTARIQATLPPPMLVIGQALDRPERRLLAILGRLVALGTDRQLLVARFSLPNGSVGEGLFTVARDGRVQSIAATGDVAVGAGLTGARFAGFSDTAAYLVNPPSVSADTSVVFKARLEQTGVERFGVFQWTGSTPTAIGLSIPAPDNLAVLPGDAPPYDLDRWAAGRSGQALFMARTTQGENRLFQRATTNLAPLVVPGVTPVMGGSVPTLGALFDFVLAGDGTSYIRGTDSGSPALFRLETPASGSRAVPMVKKGMAIPKPADGTNVTGLTFGESFALLADSARGDLMFIADVLGSSSPRRGLFRLTTQGLTTLLIENLQTDSTRSVTLGVLGGAPRQTANGMSAFATFRDGRWTLSRFRNGVTAVVATEGQTLPNGRKLVSLDAGTVIGLPGESGPVFTLNDLGAVAFLGTDGLQWGIYEFKQ